MTKQELLRMVEALPDMAAENDFDRIAVEVKRVQARARLQDSLDQIDRGEGIPHDEIEAMMDQWIEE